MTNAIVDTQTYAFGGHTEGGDRAVVMIRGLVLCGVRTPRIVAESAAKLLDTRCQRVVADHHAAPDAVLRDAEREALFHVSGRFNARGGARTAM